MKAITLIISLTISALTITANALASHMSVDEYADILTQSANGEEHRTYTNADQGIQQIRSFERRMELASLDGSSHIRSTTRINVHKSNIFFQNLTTSTVGGTGISRTSINISFFDTLHAIGDPGDISPISITARLDANIPYQDVYIGPDPTDFTYGLAELTVSAEETDYSHSASTISSIGQGKHEGTTSLNFLAEGGHDYNIWFTFSASTRVDSGLTEIVDINEGYITINQLGNSLSFYTDSGLTYSNDGIDASTPEPGTILLMSIGSILSILRKRRTNAAAKMPFTGTANP